MKYIPVRKLDQLLRIHDRVRGWRYRVLEDDDPETQELKAIEDLIWQVVKRIGDRQRVTMPRHLARRP